MLMMMMMMMMVIIINLINAYFHAAYLFQYSVFVRTQLTGK